MRPRVGAFATVLDAAGRVLLGHRTDCDFWGQPGGGLESGETPWDGVVREVREETGLEGRLERLLHLDVHEIPARPDFPAHLHLDVRFLVEADGELVASEESLDVRWCSFDEAVHLGDASVARLVASR